MIYENIEYWILNIKVNDYRCGAWNLSSSDAINKLNNSKLMIMNVNMDVGTNKHLLK